MVAGVLVITRVIKVDAIRGLDARLEIPAKEENNDIESLMRLQSSVLIRRTPEQVAEFLGAIDNIAKWDRGVGSARALSNNPGVGYEFETLGRSDSAGARPEAAKMGYRVVCAEPNHCVVALTTSTGNARFFKTAQWDFRLAPAPGGSMLTCCAEFSLRMRYIFLAPVLYVNKSAIQLDLESLKQAVENGN